MNLRLRVLLRFYRSFAAVSLVVSLVCCYYFFLFGKDVYLAILLIKLVTNAVIYFSYKTIYSKQLVFYQNLHFSAFQLWVPAFTTDTLLLLLGLFTTSSVR